MRISSLFLRVTFLAISIIVGQTASAQLSLVDVGGRFGSFPGYIDRATVVVEPHGAYVEQSLYLTYADHNTLTPSKTIEITHRFELPQGAVVNDLWLWIGDSVMQAVIMDTWSARAFYDSVVSKKHDPAFLAKNKGNYELHVFPLEAGKIRKIKLNYIVPTRWLGTDAYAEFPLKMLKQNNNTLKPLHVLFRKLENEWGTPQFLETTAAFTKNIDSAGYHYSYCYIPDIASLTSLNLNFKVAFQGGAVARALATAQDTTYFQFGFMPGQFLGLAADSLPRKVLAGIDLSGLYNKEYSTLLPNIKRTLKSAVRPQDRFKLSVGGAMHVQTITPAWLPGESRIVDSLLDAYSVSYFGRLIAAQFLPIIVYCDSHAQQIWKFTGIDKMAVTRSYTTFASGMALLDSANVIAAYDQGYEDYLAVSTNWPALKTKFTQFLSRGGRFLTYFDRNRTGREVIATSFINGLTCSGSASPSEVLVRNPDGNIGMNFPESITIRGHYHLSFNDTSARVELMTQAGDPVVISKRVGNGLLVVSGLWSFQDDDAVKSMLGVPLLGLNTVTESQQATPLLLNLRTAAAQDTVRRFIVFANTDTLITGTAARDWASTYLSGFPGMKPAVYSVNLLDGSYYRPNLVSEGSTTYYGIGYLLKQIAEQSGGMHVETHINDWSYIVSAVAALSMPSLRSLAVDVSSDNGTGSSFEMREVQPVANDPNKPRFFTGSSPAKFKLAFTARAQAGADTAVITKTFSYLIPVDTTKRDQIIPAMLGNEKLTDLFNAGGTDTSKIVGLAMRYRLLCDYTAFLAPEPNEKYHFMKNPFDETVLDVPSADVPESVYRLSIEVSRLTASLHWRTLSEFETRGFIVERRSVGTGDTAWTAVGFVAGAGASQTERQYAFADTPEKAGRYAYRIREISVGGLSKSSGAIEVYVGEVPRVLALSRNYPNPFNPSTSIDFSVPANGRATVRVFDALGRQVAVLYDGQALAGTLYRVKFDASRLSSGMYFTKLEYGQSILVRKMLLVK